MTRLLALALLLTTASAAPEPVAPHPAAIELFTSQGCSSCPPADALVGRLARQGDVVAITRPVTYWDRLGWKDTLARESNTALQRAYAGRKIAGGGTYTPQIVVQGRVGAVGGNESRVRTLIVAASRLPEPRVAIDRAARTVTLDGATSGPATVSVVALRGSVIVAIKAGESGGRRVTYYNVALADTPIGTWRGGRQRFAIPAAALATPQADRHAVLVQTAGGGPILLARYL